MRDPRRVVGAVPEDLRDPHVPPHSLDQPRQSPHVVGVVYTDLLRHHLMGIDTDGAVELHVAALFPVHPLHQSPSLVDLDAGRVDGDCDGFGGFLEALVGACVESKDAFPES